MLAAASVRRADLALLVDNVSFAEQTGEVYLMGQTLDTWFVGERCSLLHSGKVSFAEETGEVYVRANISWFVG